MVRNEILEHVFMLALAEVGVNKEQIAAECLRLALGSLEVADSQEVRTETIREIADIDRQIERAIGLCVAGIISNSELSTQRKPLDRQKAILTERLDELEDNQSIVKKQKRLQDNIQKRINQIAYTQSFSGDVAKEVLDKIVIHDKGCYDVYFKGIDGNFQMAV